MALESVTYVPSQLCQVFREIQGSQVPFCYLVATQAQVAYMALTAIFVSRTIHLEPESPSLMGRNADRFCQVHPIHAARRHSLSQFFRVVSSLVKVCVGGA